MATTWQHAKCTTVQQLQMPDINTTEHTPVHLTREIGVRGESVWVSDCQASVVTWRRTVISCNKYYSNSTEMTIIMQKYSTWDYPCLHLVLSDGDWGAGSQLLLSAQRAPAQPLPQQPRARAQWQRDPIGWQRPCCLHAPHLRARTRRPRGSFLLTCH